MLVFVNSAEDIKESFEPFYEQIVLEVETDPNIINDIKCTLDDYRVYSQIEINKFADIFYKDEQKAGDLGKLKSVLNPAIDRFIALETEEQETFKTGLARFYRICSFITQVCRMFDKEMHKFSI